VIHATHNLLRVIRQIYTCGIIDQPCGYGYGRPYYGTYWGQGRRVARRVYRRHDRWDW